MAPQAPGACRDCFAWGVTRHSKWLCNGCAAWRIEHRRVGTCISCRREVAINERDTCRLCWRQAAMLRLKHRSLDVLDANRYGQQLFFADMFLTLRRRGHQVDGETAPAVRDPLRPLACRQLLLLRHPVDVSAVRRHGFSPPPDRRLAVVLDDAARDHAARHGWSRTRTKTARQAIRLLLAVQESPGAAFTASEVEMLAQVNLPVRAVQTILAEVGMLDDDRVPAINAWFARTVADLPTQMVIELGIWFEVLRDGSATPPRSRSRADVTIRTRLGWARPALRAWAEAGYQSLRQVTRADVIATLPPSGTPRATVGAGLRSIFRVLRSRKVVFINPIARVATGSPEGRLPLPVDVDVLRNGLKSLDLTQAALVALVALHGLRAGELRRLQLIDVRDGRLHVGERHIVLAAVARSRLSAYLDYRNSRWPRTANPYLFIHYRTATQAVPVGPRWFGLRVGMPVRVLRNDRILDEAHASAGDARRLCDLFGVSVNTALRYTNTVDHPDFASIDDRQGPAIPSVP